MANISHASSSHTLAQHYANIEASLTHRLEVARDANDIRLVQLLERERQQVRWGTTQQPVSQARGWLKTLWQGLVEAFSNKSELRAWQAVDEAGILWWCAYNPETGESVYADTETEMRLWIKQHYRGQ